MMTVFGRRTGRVWATTWASKGLLRQNLTCFSRSVVSRSPERVAESILRIVSMRWFFDTSSCMAKEGRVIQNFCGVGLPEAVFRERRVERIESVIHRLWASSNL